MAKYSGEEYFGPYVRLSGAEIEAWVKDSLMEAYARKTNGEPNADLSMNDFVNILKRMVPMAKMRQEYFKDLRDWANDNAVSATMYANSDNNENAISAGRKLDLI